MTQSPGVHARLGRDELLARVDLTALADEILGPGRRHGVHTTWTCPTHQPQTGRTPPVSIFTTSRGEQRWHCHACGAGGTAIDLLVAAHSMSVRDAFAALATYVDVPAKTPGRPRRHDLPRPSALAPDPVVAAHVQRCAELLWSDHGKHVRAWLHTRGFTDETLHAHRIGADPGRRVIPRPPGLPGQGSAAIFAVVERDTPVYFQARYLDPERAGGRKYDNPTAALAPNPRLATLQPTGEAHSRAVFVCEGLPDALSIAQTGHRSVALLGVGLAGPQIAQRLNARYPSVAIRIAFDADPRGMMARDALLGELQGLGHPNAGALDLGAGHRDINEWLRADASGLARALGVAAQAGVVKPGLGLEI